MYPNGTVNWKLGDPSDPEDLCEVMFRLLQQGGVKVNVEMVNAVRDRLDLPPVEEISERRPGQRFERSDA